MKNLRVTPKRKWVDTYGTGDHQSYNVFEVVRDFTSEELAKRNYSQEVIDGGVPIETFNSEDNAKLFKEALEAKHIDTPLKAVSDAYSVHKAVEKSLESKKVCCPECGGANVRSFDNEPLSHSTKEEVANGAPNYDNEVYVWFTCGDCKPNGGRGFKVVFDLIPQIK